MRLSGWHPPIEPTPEEQTVLQRVKRAKLFVFPRNHRHEIFTGALPRSRARFTARAPSGGPRCPPAQLALATILQAYTSVSDDEAIEAMAVGRRWQLALGCMDAREPPFSKGTLVGLGMALIEHALDRRLIECTVALA